MAIEASIIVPKPVPVSGLAKHVIGQLGEVETFSSGQKLLNRGSNSTALYVIEEGEVELIVGEASASIGSGELVGEHGFLEGSEAATAIARTPTRARRVNRDELVNALAGNPKSLYLLLDEIQRLQHTRGTVDAKSDADSYVASLAQESLSHRAVRHPYLQMLAQGELPDLRWALRDFATQYYGYSRYFPRYLTTVMSRLDTPEHRNALLDNLTEESGSYEEGELEELEGLGIDRSWF
ncbi:MAG: cyclic nucleotide-binding domain-containing protein, partial [Myxococcota bacterium]